MVAMDQMPAASARTRHRSLRSAQYPQTGANKDPVKLCTMSTAPWRKGDKPISTSSARKELASAAPLALSRKKAPQSTATMPQRCKPSSLGSLELFRSLSSSVKPAVLPMSGDDSDIAILVAQLLLTERERARATRCARDKRVNPPSLSQNVVGQ